MIAMVVDGQPRACIVVSDSASLVERHAAAELTKYICQMSGAQLPVETTPSDNKTNIYIGRAAPTEGLDISEETLGFDGYMVKTIGHNIVLVGIKPYSCLYATYHLLTKHLGFGFFEDGDQVPRQSSVTVRELNDVCKPRFEWRNKCVAHFPAYSGHRWYSEEEWKQWFDWLAKTRINTCEVGWLARYTGIEALAAAKFGIKIELTPWQEQNLADDAATLQPRTDVRYPLLARGHLAHAMARYRAWINALLRWRSDRRILAQVPGINWLKGANCAL